MTDDGVTDDGVSDDIECAPLGHDEQVEEWEAEQAELEGQVIEEALASIEAREAEPTVPQPTWQEIALAHGWTPPPKVEVPFKLLFKLGGHDVVHWHNYGVVIPDIAITGGSFDEAAKIVAGYHRWMPTQYTITHSIIPTMDVDWCSAESVLDAIVTTALAVDDEGA